MATATAAIQRGLIAQTPNGRSVSAAAEGRRLHAVVRRAIEDCGAAAEAIIVVIVNPQISNRSLPTVTSPRKCMRAASIQI